MPPSSSPPCREAQVIQLTITDKAASRPVWGRRPGVLQTSAARIRTTTSFPTRSENQSRDPHRASSRRCAQPCPATPRNAGSAPPSLSQPTTGFLCFQSHTRSHPQHIRLPPPGHRGARAAHSESRRPLTASCPTESALMERQKTKRTDLQLASRVRVRGGTRRTQVRRGN